VYLKTTHEMLVDQEPIILLHPRISTECSQFEVGGA
jgi:hypothetical protein